MGNSFLLGRVYGAWGYLPRETREMLAASAPDLSGFSAADRAVLSDAMAGLFGPADRRLAALQKIKDLGAVSWPLLPMVGGLARRDPEFRVFSAATWLLKNRVSAPGVLALLKELKDDESAHSYMRHLAEGELLLARLQAEEERRRSSRAASEATAQLDEISSSAFEVERLLARAKAAAAGLGTDLVSRLRREALEEAVLGLEEARNAGTPDLVSIACRRLRDLLAAATPLELRPGAGRL